MLIYQTPAPVVATPQVTPGPSQLYEALTNQRTILQDQMEELVGQRADLVRQVRNATENGVTGPGKSGLEDRIAALDKRIAGMDQQIALADAQVAKAAAVPGAIVPHQEPPRSGPPDEAFVLGGLFMIIVFLPLSIAYARRIWKRTGTAPAAIPAELTARVQRIEQAVEASGLEIERIGEGQRFITKLLSEKVPALPAARDESRASNS